MKIYPTLSFFLLLFCCDRAAAQNDYYKPLPVILIDPTFDHRSDKVVFLEQRAAKFHIKSITIIQNDIRVIGNDTTRKNNIDREHYTFSPSGKILRDSSLLPAEYFYDASDRMIKVVYGSSNTRYIYNKAGKVQVVIDSGFAVDKQYYTFDEHSRPVKCEYYHYYSEKNVLDSTLEQFMEFGYDAQGRLSTWKRKTVAYDQFERNMSFHYDSTGTIGAPDADPCNSQFSWNKSDFLVHEIQCFGPFQNNQYLKAYVDYTYADAGDITSIHSYSSNQDVMQVFQNYYLPNGLPYLVKQSYKKDASYVEFLYSYTFYK